MPIDAPVRDNPVRVAEPTFTVRWLPPHKVVVFNNDHNSFDEVVGVLMKAIPGCDQMTAIGLTDEIHLTGLAVVFCGDVEEAETCARTIRAIGIKVTVEPDA